MTAHNLYEYLSAWTEEQRRSARVTLQKGKSGSADTLVDIKIGRPRSGGFTLKLIAPSGYEGAVAWREKQKEATP